MNSIKNIDNYNNQELTLIFELSNYYNEGSSYSFYLENKYTDENNVSYDYSITYEGKFYNIYIFLADENNGWNFLSDIEKLIKNKIKNLNPIVNDTIIEFNKGVNLKYGMELLFQDRENIFPKIKANLEDIFNSIISILKSKNAILEEKPLDELIKKRYISFTLNNENLKMEIFELFKIINNLTITINYKGRLGDRYIYEFNSTIKMGESEETEINRFSINSNKINYSIIFNNYNDYLEFMIVLNPKILLDRIKNHIIKSKSKIEKKVNEYGFNYALTIIDEFIKGKYDERIINKLKEEEWVQNLIQNLIQSLNKNLKDNIINKINC